MKSRLLDYNEGFRIVSACYDLETKIDLLADKLDFLMITDKSVILYPEENIYCVENICLLHEGNNYDVMELWEDGSLHYIYSNSSIDNYFFVTGKCNSNCIMCPSPDIVRKNAESSQVENLISIAEHIPSDAPHLTITGGEPFLGNKSVFRFLTFLRDKFEETEFLILTNGRVFALDSYVALLEEACPNNTIFGIPIHGSNAQIHDGITRSENSWQQTVIGLKKLLNRGFRVELRVVINRINMADFYNIVELIISEFPKVEYVSVIAMEMTGNAYVNQKAVWIPYKESFLIIEKGIKELLKAGIDVKLYNYPLCTVNKEYWTLCEKSISPNKVRFSPQCKQCKQKEACGGVFAGSYKFVENEMAPIL